MNDAASGLSDRVSQPPHAAARSRTWGWEGGPGPRDREELRRRFGAILREHRGARTPEVFADLADIPSRTYRQLEKGQAAVELDVLVKVAAALGIEPLDLLARVFPPTPRRSARDQDVDERWAELVVESVEENARGYGIALHRPGVIAAVAALVTIAEKAPGEVPFLASLLGSRAQDLNLPFADRLRRLQVAADQRATQLRREARKSGAR